MAILILITVAVILYIVWSADDADDADVDNMGDFF